jgi:RibD C-terminal domain
MHERPDQAALPTNDSNSAKLASWPRAETRTGLRTLRVQQYLSAGLLDEMVVSVVPVLLGGGARLFDNLGEPKPTLRQVEAVEAPAVTHIRYARQP